MKIRWDGSRAIRQSFPPDGRQRPFPAGEESEIEVPDEIGEELCARPGWSRASTRKKERPAE